MLGLLLLIMGCTETTAPALPTTAATAVQSLSDPSSATTIVARPAETLVPTFTPPPTAAARAATGGQSASDSEQNAAPSATPVDFNQVIVELSYEVPGLGLDRVLIGDMANRIIFLDKATGRQVEYSNQGGVLLELRQALSDVELQPLPADCQFCVQIEYQLSLDSLEGVGWLQDEVLLASVENFMAVALGAHFPKDTAVGLRRSATAFAPAHTVAFKEDGSLYAWLAIEPQIAAPLPAAEAFQSLSPILDALPIAEIPDSYVISCYGSPVESLFIRWGETARAFNIVCPEFSLTADLLPLYLQLETVASDKLLGVALERPQAAFSLDQLLSYRRSDGARLNLFYGGLLVANDVDGSTQYTRTLTDAQIEDLFATVLAGELLQPGIKSFSPTATPVVTDTGTIPAPVPSSTLVVRTADGLYDARWSDQVTNSALFELDRILNEMLGLPNPVQADEAAPVPAATTTQGVEATPTP